MTWTLVATTVMFGVALASTAMLIFQAVVILACVKDLPEEDFVSVNYFTNNLIYITSILWASFFFLVRL